MKNEDDNNHALQNAKGWADSIVEFYDAYVKLQDGEENVEVDSDPIKDEDALRERVAESVLAIQVRSNWHDVGDPAEDAEFYVLLSTGGPALRLIGDLDLHNQPTDVRMEYQDWGTPWTEHHPDHENWDDALEFFLGCFYFGD